MPSPILFCSDIHLCPETPDRNARFFRWMAGLSNLHLVIVGDLFHYWWNYAELPTAYAQLLEPFKHLASRGVELSLVAGNHDFALPMQLQTRPLILPEDLVIDHGDSADNSLGYRVIHRTLRSAGFASLMHRLKPQQGFAFLKMLAGTSERPYSDNRRLISAQREYGLRRLKNARWVLQGHSHYLAHEHYAEGELIWLGDWVHHCSYVRYLDGQLQLCCWREGGPEKEVVVAVKKLSTSEHAFFGEFTAGDL